MTKKIKTYSFWLLDDSDFDAELMQQVLSESFPASKILHLHNKESLIEALSKTLPDVLISDFNLGSFNGADALLLLKKEHPTVPFILVSGTIGDENAVELMKNGATDYVLKDNLDKLPLAISRALKEAEAHRRQLRTAHNLQRAQQLAKMGSYQYSPINQQIEFCSPALLQLLGYEDEDTKPQVEFFLNNVHDNDRQYVAEINQICFAQDSPQRHKFRYNLNGKTRWLLLNCKPYHSQLFDQKVLGIVQDITDAEEAARERQQLITQLENQNKELSSFNYILSHNLRAPVANLQALSSLLGDSMRGKLDSAELTSLEHMIESVQKIDYTIKDLNEAMALKQITSDVLIPVQVKQLILELKADIDEDIDWNIRCSANTVALAHQQYLKEVFQELVNNSLKFVTNRDKLELSISAKEQAGSVKIVFQDNGDGLPNTVTDVDRVFGLHQRLHVEIPGFGLGLFLSRQKIEAMNGSLSAENQEGKGLKLIFNLPSPSLGSEPPHQAPSPNQ